MTTTVEKHKIPVDEDYKESALNTLITLVKGNGCSAEDITLESFDGEILQFRAENNLAILTKLSEKRVAGRLEGPIKVDNEIAAKSAISSAYKKLGEDHDLKRKIREIILNRTDKGFGIQNDVIPLPFYKKEFVVFEPCNTCKTTGTILCLPCNGKGMEPCPRCHGSGLGNCTHCNGAQMVNGPNNQRIQCPICHGKGHTMCNSCQQRGSIQCKTCRSSGITTCPNCKGNAWSSHLHIMEIQARTSFNYPRDQVPEKVANMIDKHGSKIKDHAKINIIPQEETEYSEHITIPIKYDVSLPYGHVEYNIKGKTYYIFLFGTQSRLTHVSPFLDDLVKNGVRKLKDAAELRGDVTENLKAAAQYRTVKEGIIYAALHGQGKAQKALKAKNIIGLSDGTIKDIIETADTALRNITRKPRITGLVYATILNALIFGTYFFTFRDKIISNIPNQNIHHIIDLLSLGVTTYLGILIIQMTAQTALKTTLIALLPEGIKKSSPPKLGNILYYSLGMSAALFGGLYAIAVL